MRQVLNLMQSILDNGNKRLDRTGTGTYSLFAPPDLRFNLNQGFPLMTTKKVFLRGIIEELLWFLSGSTDNNDLTAKNVHIWDEWAIPQYEDVLFTKEERYDAINTSEHIDDYLDMTAQEVFYSQPEEVKEEQKIKWCQERGIRTSKLVFHDNHGALGPVYGKQFRSWKDVQVALSVGRKLELQRQGYNCVAASSIEHEVMGGSRFTRSTYEMVKYFDQIGALIEGLKEKPFSRRHVVSTWNVADLPDESLSPQENVLNGKMALAPCHVLMQFYVQEITQTARCALYDKLPDKGQGTAADEQAKWDAIPRYRLSCKLTQRSADVALGLPFNIASYALLTMMVAQCVDMLPGDFIHSLGDAHIYTNHLEGVNEQLGRTPYPLPTMRINPAKKNIFDFNIDDFELVGYESHPAIKFPVST